MSSVNSQGGNNTRRSIIGAKDSLYLETDRSKLHTRGVGAPLSPPASRFLNDYQFVR